MNNQSLDVYQHVQRVLIAVGIVALFLVLVYLLYRAAQILLLLFACILVAVFLDGLAVYLSDRTLLSRGWALALVLTLLLVISVAGGWLMGPRIADQVVQLTERIPDAVESIRSGLLQYEWVQRLLSSTPEPQQILPLGSEVLGSLTGIFSTAVGYVTSVPVVLFLGVYLAASPHLYIKGAIHLLPLARRNRAREVFDALGQALRWWLIGRMASMAVVGALTVLGLSIIGVSLALTLGLIAALLSFVPYLGPVLSAIPALLVVLVESPKKVIHVALVYSAVQALESYFITPLIQHRAVSIPPALLLIAQILMGVLAGPVGVLLSTPLAVVVVVVVQMLYVQDVLGDSIEALGEQSSSHTPSGG